MKNSMKPINVELIGEQKSPLTKEEEKAISEFLRAKNEKRKLRELRADAKLKRNTKQPA